VFGVGGLNVGADAGAGEVAAEEPNVEDPNVEDPNPPVLPPNGGEITLGPPKVEVPKGF